MYFLLLKEIIIKKCTIYAIRLKQIWFVNDDYLDNYYWELSKNIKKKQKVYLPSDMPTITYKSKLVININIKLVSNINKLIFGYISEMIILKEDLLFLLIL